MRTITMRRKRFPAKTTSQRRLGGRSSTIRPTADSSARSGSDWSIGRSCGGSDLNRSFREALARRLRGTRGINRVASNNLARRSKGDYKHLVQYLLLRFCTVIIMSSTDDVEQYALSSESQREVLIKYLRTEAYAVRDCFTKYSISILA